VRYELSRFSYDPGLLKRKLGRELLLALTVGQTLVTDVQACEQGNESPFKLRGLIIWSLNRNVTVPRRKLGGGEDGNHTKDFGCKLIILEGIV